MIMSWFARNQSSFALDLAFLCSKIPLFTSDMTTSCARLFGWHLFQTHPLCRSICRRCRSIDFWLNKVSTFDISSFQIVEGKWPRSAYSSASCSAPPFVFSTLRWVEGFGLSSSERSIDISSNCSLGRRRVLRQPMHLRVSVLQSDWRRGHGPQDLHIDPQQREMVSSVVDGS